MIEPPLQPIQDRVETAVRWLDAMSRALRYGVIPALVIAALVVLVVSSNRTAALVILGSGLAVVAGLVLAGTLGALAALLRVNAAVLESAARIDGRLAEGFERIARSFEDLKTARPAAPTAAEMRTLHLAEVRHAIRSGHWDDARSLVQAFADGHPDDPEAHRLSDELTEARQVAVRERLVKIEAAREANDPDRVIELRDEVKPMIDAEGLHALDRDLAKWFMMAIHRRLRAGTVRADVAVLAGRVAGTFDDTPEGASLRASLPTLRRAAGLCARCAQPYTGIADACPACLAGVPATTPAADPVPTDPEPDGSP